MKTAPTRERWLIKACRALLDHFDLTPRGPWRVTCGWPSRRAISARARTLGEAWSERASGDGTIEIIVSLAIEDPVEVLAVAAHELVHAALPEGVGHRAPFARKVRAMGLEGKPTATRPGPAFVEAIQPILAEVLRDGYTIESVCEYYGISIQTFYRWKERFGGIPPDQAEKLRSLELENARLKREVRRLKKEQKALKSAIEQESGASSP